MINRHQTARARKQIKKAFNGPFFKKHFVESAPEIPRYRFRCGNIIMAVALLAHKSFFAGNSFFNEFSYLLLRRRRRHDSP